MGSSRAVEAGSDVEPEADLDPAVLGPRRGARRVWAVGLVVAVLALACGAAALVAGTGDDPGFSVDPSSLASIAVEVTAVGTLEPLSTVEVGSDLTGKVASVSVEENDPVTRGQVLAEIDPEPFEAAVSEGRARVSAASAALARVRIEAERAAGARDRTKRLEARGASTAVETAEAGFDADAAVANVAAAEAELAQAWAALASAERDLADTTIRAPIDGVVLHRFVEPGQTVVSSMSATALFEVASDLASLRIDAGIDEADIGAVVAGLPATFTVSAWPDETFTAWVASVDVAPDPDEEVVEYDALLLVDNTHGMLRPGMTATAAIRVESLHDVVTVPNAALRWRPEGERDDGDVVHVLRDGVPSAVPVEVLGTDGTRTAVRGLDADEPVIVGGGA